MVWSTEGDQVKNAPKWQFDREDLNGSLTGKTSMHKISVHGTGGLVK